MAAEDDDTGKREFPRGRKPFEEQLPCMVQPAAREKSADDGIRDRMAADPEIGGEERRPLEAIRGQTVQELLPDRTDRDPEDNGEGKAGRSDEIILLKESVLSAPVLLTERKNPA